MHTMKADDRKCKLTYYITPDQLQHISISNAMKAYNVTNGLIKPMAVFYPRRQVYSYELTQ